MKQPHQGKGKGERRLSPSDRALGGLAKSTIQLFLSALFNNSLEDPRNTVGRLNLCPHKCRLEMISVMDRLPLCNMAQLICGHDKLRLLPLYVTPFILAFSTDMHRLSLHWYPCCQIR